MVGRHFRSLGELTRILVGSMANDGDIIVDIAEISSGIRIPHKRLNEVVTTLECVLLFTKVMLRILRSLVEVWI